MNEIIVALDDMNRDRALKLASQLSGKCWGFKVNDLLVQYGCGIVHELKRFGNVFADPKLYDIPNTVRNSVKQLVFAGADMISCHVSGGVSMLKAAMDESKDCKIIGVTMLTSMNFDDIRQTYRGYPLERFGEAVAISRIHGVVCSGQEVAFWSLFDLLKVVPGVRPFGSIANDDQVRSSTDNVAANYLVIGRPITTAKDPLIALTAAKEKYK